PHAAWPAAGRRYPRRCNPAERRPHRRSRATNAEQLVAFREPVSGFRVRPQGRDPERVEKVMAMYDNLLANVPTDLWIGGKWRKSSDRCRFRWIDPATENKVASVASATVDDAMAALDAASGAFAAWAGKKPRERAEVLRKSYELIMRDAERLAKLITIENGKALSDSRGEVAYAA